jgi:hypothetical protein
MIPMRIFFSEVSIAHPSKEETRSAADPNAACCMNSFLVIGLLIDHDLIKTNVKRFHAKPQRRKETQSRDPNLIKRLCGFAFLAALPETSQIP